MKNIVVRMGEWVEGSLVVIGVIGHLVDVNHVSAHATVLKPDVDYASELINLRFQLKTPVLVASQMCPAQGSFCFNLLGTPASITSMACRTAPSPPPTPVIIIGSNVFDDGTSSKSTVLDDGGDTADFYSNVDTPTDTIYLMAILAFLSLVVCCFCWRNARVVKKHVPLLSQLIERVSWLYDQMRGGNNQDMIPVLRAHRGRRLASVEDAADPASVELDAGIDDVIHQAGNLRKCDHHRDCRPANDTDYPHGGVQLRSSDKSLLMADVTHRERPVV